MDNEANEQQQDADWERENASITPAKWRDALARWLVLAADLGRQKTLFLDGGSDREQHPIQDWPDLNSVYLTSLNLENGFAHARRRGFLSAKEVDLLQPFDAKFRHYFPQDYDDDRKTLRDPEWVRITLLAQGLLKTLVPKLATATKKKA